jgi:hypothetical protein
MELVFVTKASMLQDGTFLRLPYPLIGHIACVGFLKEVISWTDSSGVVVTISRFNH